MLKIELWPEQMIVSESQLQATISYHAPTTTPTGSAVVVCPGGGYTMLADHEAFPVAEWLNGLGIAAFILRYRLAPNRHPAMHDDVSRAIRTVRSVAQAPEFDPNKIGILGFSAGGHLAASAATIFDEGKSNSLDPVETYSSRPDLAILIYPVIDLSGTYGHTGSANNLLGEGHDPELANSLSLHKRVTPTTCPSFLVHSVNDKAVPVENSLMFAMSLSKNKIPFELHVYEHGGHGYGLAPNDPSLSKWKDLCADWLKRHDFG